MFEYDDRYCYVEGNDLTHHVTTNKLILNEIINKLKTKVNLDTPYYKVLCSQNKIDYLKYSDTAKKIRENFQDVVVISMGGAALNPQSMLKLILKKSNVNIHFLDNTDPIFFKNLIESLNLKQTAFLTISNSGETLETITLLGIVLNQFKQHNITDLSDNFYFITNLNNSTLFKLATLINAKIYPHASEISGRFAGFTDITTLIGLIADLDMQEFIDGGNQVFDNLWKDKEDSMSARAAATIMSSAKPILVNLGYLQKFSSYLDWYSQIIAESLGKSAKGFTPFKSLAPNDHHSMLQLYLDGPRDKLFTMFHVKKIDENIGHFKTLDNAILGDLSNRSIENINDTIFNAALKTFKAQHIPFRTIILNDLSTKAVGALMAHSMVEIILVGHMLEVNPFDQPSVELLKKHVRDLLKAS